MNITDCLPASILSFLHNNIPVLFIWLRKRLPHFQVQKWDPVNPGQSKKSNPLVRKCVGNEHMTWFLSRRGWLEASGEVLSCPEENRTEVSFVFQGIWIRKDAPYLLLLAAILETTGEARFKIKLTGGRGQRFREKEPWTYYKQNLSTPDFQRSDSQLFPTTACMMDDVYICRTHFQGCIHCVSMCDSRDP